ncbi:MAG: hypothetical protein C0467_23625 [Planctomycetaceae bacterium]|nr:hypothetical protein [Planctomycetaceae bacterium]
MVRRTLGGLLFILGTGTANAQLPAVEPGSPPSATTINSSPLPPKVLPTIPDPANSAADRVATLADSPATTPAKAAPASIPPAVAAPAPMSCTDLTCNPCPVPKCCTPCYPNECVWASAEWLYWAASGNPLPPLVTTSNTGGTGALVPGNTLLYGNSRANNDFRSGLRINGGIWFGECRRYGLEGDFFTLGNSSQGIVAGNSAAPGSPLIARPFFNAITGLPDSQLVTLPGILAGTVSVNAQNSIIGGGFNFRHNLCCDPCGRIDLIYGYRYFNVTDDLTITEDLTTTGAAPLIGAGVRFQIVDHFRTENSFNGGVIGLAGERQRGRWVVSGRASIAFGANTQTVTIDGATTTTPPGGPAVTLPGGLLTQSSNIGTYERTTFAVMPEIGVKLGYKVTNHLQVFAGYNFIYLSNVVRAGDQIDLRVNPNLLPPANGLGGPLVPAFAFKETDFWVQGISLGLRLSY